MAKLPTVLLAEDEANDVFLMQRALLKMGSPVLLEVASDGIEVIRYLSGVDEFADREVHPLPSLILLDIKMPRRDGFEVLAWLKTSGTLLHIPVTMLTSSNVNRDMERAFSLGATDYLIKPVAFNVLQDIFIQTATDQFAYSK